MLIFVTCATCKILIFSKIYNKNIKLRFLILIFIKELYISIFNLYICCILQCLRDNTYTVLNFI